MKSNLKQAFHYEPFLHPGYRPPNRIWEPGISCACDLCRYHKPRKCPALGEGVKTVTLWTSRER